MTESQEGVAKLESTLAGTRVNSARALRELHAAMWRDLRRAERRAERAERKVVELRTRMRRERSRADAAERRLDAVARPAPPSRLRRVVGTARGRLRRLRRR